MSKAHPKRGIQVAIGLFAVGVWMENGVLIFASMIGLGIYLFIWYWGKSVLRDVTYERRLKPRNVMVGEEAELTIQVENRKIWPVLSFNTRDLVTRGLEFSLVELERSHLPKKMILEQKWSLGSFKRLTRRYMVKAEQRGLYSLGPLTIEGSEPLGLFRDKKSFEEQRDRLVVYPKILPLRNQDDDRYRPFGDLGKESWLFSDPTMIRGVRDYQSGDAFNLINWKATARTGSLKVNELESSFEETVALFVNVNVSKEVWQGIDPERLELLVLVAAAIVNHYFVRGLEPEMHINQVGVIRDKAMLTYALESLAVIDGRGNRDFARFLQDDIRKVPLGHTIHVVTAYVDEDLEAVLQKFRDEGRTLRVTCLANGIELGRQRSLSRGIPLTLVDEGVPWNERDEIVLRSV